MPHHWRFLDTSLVLRQLARLRGMLALEESQARRSLHGDFAPRISAAWIWSEMFD
jgi:hypothetical protein